MNDKKGKLKNPKDLSHGTLYICATPIGNLEDASFRLIKTLKTVDLILSEDTRTTRKLLSRFEIKNAKLESFHDNTSEDKVNAVIKRLENGFNIALVSESGMPLISDPGYKLVKICQERNINLTVIPGPNAAISALVLSGLATDNFLFIGFLPKTEVKIKKKLEEIKNLPFTIIFYESPNRVEKLLKILFEILGDRQVCLARELTKIYEECIRGSISEVLRILQERASKEVKLKGEIVICVSGAVNLDNIKIQEFNNLEIENELRDFVKQGLNKKEIFKIILNKYKINKHDLYDIFVKVNKNKI